VNLPVPPRRHDATLRCLSAGQGPILRFDAASGSPERIDSDVVPLGVLNDLELPPPREIRMAPGDILAVISDGIFEAEDATGSRFGAAKTGEIIIRHAAETPSRILVAVRQAVHEYTGGAAGGDDRTAIIVKRAAA
jgi:serine phosphatase RsbU (regulator of sigma subunit)